VQVDYERRILRVNRTRPFLVQGYYDVPGCGRNSSTPHGVCFNLSDIPNQARLGYTAVLYYNWMEASARQQRRALDTLAAHGMMLMLHITYLLEDIACGGTAGEPLSNCTKSASAEARAWVAVIGQIKQVRKTPSRSSSGPEVGPTSAFYSCIPTEMHGPTCSFRANLTTVSLQWKDHPALLGWYLCDDCFGQYLRRQGEAGTPTLDTIYAKIKALDPAHVLIGANNAGMVSRNPLSLLQPSCVHGDWRARARAVTRTMSVDLSGPLLESLAGKRQSFARERSRYVQTHGRGTPTRTPPSSPRGRRSTS
jgi:hypothetical protein